MSNKIAKMIGLMADLNGMTFISIDTETTVKLQGGKSNAFQGRVTKRVTGSSVMVFQNKKSNGYENMIRRRLEKEGKNPDRFHLSPRAWGERLPELPFVQHKDKYYLEVIFLKAGEVEYLIDGQPYADYHNIPGIVLEHEEAEQGGLDDKVIIRTYGIDSVRAITINKQRHEF